MVTAVRRARWSTALTALLLLGGSAPLARADRPDDPNTTELFHFDAGDVIESYDAPGGGFRIVYTRDGNNAVPSTDADTNGIPDRVEALALIYEEVAAFYLSRGFAAPLSDATTSGNNGGDGRFDVYLVDFGHSADGAFRRESCDGNGLCSGFIVQENDFAGYGYPSRTYADRVLASHEFFHAVQAAYDNDETTIFSEGTAVWATEQFDPSLDDLEGFVDGYLNMPDRSIYLPQTGPVDSFSYGASLFFQYLGEAYGDDTIKALLVTCAGHDIDWFTALDAVLAGKGTNFAAAFVDFAGWNLYTAARASQAVSYAHGDEYPLVKIEPVTLPAEIPMKRLFPSATYYVAGAVGGRAQMEARAVMPDGVDGSNITVGVALRTGNIVASPITGAAAKGATIAFDASGAEEVIFFFVNTAKSGESVRPSLCLGDPVEVAACVAKYEPPPTTPPGGDGGCNTTSSPPTTAATLLLTAAAMVSLLDYRRRLRARARTAAPSRSN